MTFSSPPSPGTPGPAEHPAGSGGRLSRRDVLRACRKPVPTAELAERLGLTMPAAETYLRALEGAGFVASDAAGVWWIGD